MSTSLAIRNETQVPDRWDDAELIRTLKETVCKGATEAQFRMFIEVCKGTGLNPLLKEVYFVPGVGVIAGRDGYLRVANENPNFDGMETLVERDQKGIPIKATCSVWRKDRSHPITCEAYFNEYKKGGNVWSTYPSAMISKVAEVLALKRSFSINGVVTEEEIGSEEDRGSRESQNAVAERKIAELKARRPTQAEAEAALEIQGNERIIDVLPEPPALPPAPESEVEATPEAKNKFSEMMGHFADLKAECKKHGCEATAYYGTLQHYGLKHANQFKNFDDARAAFRAIGKALAQHKATAQPMPSRGDVRAAADARPDGWTILGNLGVDLDNANDVDLERAWNALQQ